MVRKLDIRRLLSKGLSGMELGRLVVRDLYDIDQGRKGVLSDRDIQDIKAALQTQGDIRDYNRVIDLYKAVYMSIQEARIMSLQLQKVLNRVTVPLHYYAVSAGLRMLSRQLPVIMTAKEYEAEKKRQRQKLQKRLYSLAQVLEWRTEELLGGPEKAEEEASEEEWAEAWKRADQEVQKLIKARKLKPVRLGHKASLMTVKEAEEAREHPLVFDIEPLPDKDREELGLPPETPEDREKEQERRQAEYLERVEASLAQGDQTQGHDVEFWPERGIEPEDEERLLYHYIPGSQLYKAGLPEWRRFVEEFKVYEIPGQEERDRLAILQEDVSMWATDREGRYDSRWLDKLQDYMKVREKETEYATDHAGTTLEETLKYEVRLVSDMAKGLLSYLLVLNDAAKVAGLPAEMEEAIYYSDAASDIATYNEMAKGMWQQADIDPPRLPAIDLAKLKPDKVLVRILRERIASGVYGGGLGATWWTAVSEDEEEPEEEAEDGQA